MFLCLSSSLYSIDVNDFQGIWNVNTVEAIQIIQLYTTGFDHFTNGYRIRHEYVDDPLVYVEFDFIDEDLLYITRADGTRLRGFYQLKNNTGINSSDYPYYLYLEDKYTNVYYFPVRVSGEDTYEINYKLELIRRDELIQITCVAELVRVPSQ
jgi:hypothetical protein